MFLGDLVNGNKTPGLFEGNAVNGSTSFDII
jgi:hypothetical protein